MRAATRAPAGRGTAIAIAALLVLAAVCLAAAIPALREPAVLMALTYGAPGILVFALLARIWRKGPDAADGPRDGADGEKPPADG
ncbi:hypothetical protein [Arthrobacter sp. NPDC056727]|uniref:hypothetical protein n=1 Tax=Arthrobacter sp. NPDC056727 TaxID=3345927 RepID=UPI00366A93F6